MLVPLALFYRLFKAFPADIHYFYLNRVASVSTYCSHPYYHTPFDDAAHLQLERFSAIKESLMSLLQTVMDHLLEQRKAPGDTVRTT
jgi:hypothetical protein